MEVLRNAVSDLVLTDSQRQMLPFQPVADLFMDIDLPHLPGSKTVHVDFGEELDVSNVPKSLNAPPPF